MKILVIKTSALGDIVHTFPAVDFLRKVVPEAEIEWVVEKGCASLIEPYYKTHQIDTRKWRKNIFSSWREIKQAVSTLRENTYEVVFDFQGNIKTGIILSLIKAKLKVGFGKKTVPEKPNLFFTDLQVDPEVGLNIRQDYLGLVEAWANKKASQSEVIKKEEPAFMHIMVCPGSKWENKRLKEETLTFFLKEIQEKKHCKFWILHGSREEKKVAETLIRKLQNAEVMESMSLPKLEQFMKQMDEVIAMDSLPLHLAGKMGIPTFSIFGPSLADKYRPMGKIHRSVQGACPYGHHFIKRCPFLRTCPTGSCIKNLDSHQLALRFLHE